MAQPVPVALTTPMPTPGSSSTPLFKGERVTDFLDSLESHADAANVRRTDLPGFVLRYCHRRVRRIIENAAYWDQHDWPATRAYLVDLYASSDRKPRNSPDRLRKWVRIHAENRLFAKLQDVDRYYREFSAQSTPLITTSRLTQNEANLLFYRGIPPAMRKKVKRKIPANQQTATTAPAIVSVLGLLRKQFDEDDLDHEDEDVELSLDTEDDFSDTDDEDTLPPPSRKRKVKVRFETKEVPGAIPVQPPEPTNIDTLTKQMEELRVGHARQLEDIRQGQAMLLRELTASRGIGPSTTRNINQNMSVGGPDTSCFICDGILIHRPGLNNCPDVQKLVNKNLIKYAPNGRLVRIDDSPLPRVAPGTGGVARTLQHERSTAQSLKGKAREVRDSPPHMAHYASLQMDGADFFVKDIFAVSSSPTSFPVTHSQVKDTRFDPTKGKRPDRNAKEDSEQMPTTSSPR